MSTLEAGDGKSPQGSGAEKKAHSPVVHAELKRRADDWQLHLADRITSFAGSMKFIWVHVFLFAVWVTSGLFGHDHYPFQFLTFVVSLEAIFLSTFVMIGQNRQASFQQSKADHDFHEVEIELRQNTELTRAIEAQTQEIHTLAADVRQRLGGAPTTGISPAT